MTATALTPEELEALTPPGFKSWSEYEACFNKGKTILAGDWLPFRDAADFNAFYGGQRALPETCIGLEDSECRADHETVLDTLSCGCRLVDEPDGFYYHRTRHVARCTDCQEAEWISDGYEVENGIPSCRNHGHTCEQRIAERKLDALQESERFLDRRLDTPEGRVWLATAEGQQWRQEIAPWRTARLSECANECERLDVRPTELCKLLNSICGVLRRYIVFQFQEQAKITALWILHTWVLGAFDYSPYLFVTAASKRSGKSRVLEVSEFLAKNAKKTESASSAALVRSIDKDNPPSFLLDEVDQLYSGKKSGDAEATSTCRFLNAGYRRGATFLRCVGQGANLKAEEFPAFCPKMLAGIGRCLPDTVADRSITIELVRQTREERAERLRDREARKALKPLKDKLAEWSQQDGVIATLRDARPVMPDQLHDRAQDICEPFLALSDLAGGSWREGARSALIKLYGGEEDTDIGVRLLAAIKVIFDEKKAEKLPTKEILTGLVAMEDGPWASWFEDALTHDKLKTAGSKLHRLLKRYRGDGIEHCKIRVGDETAWGYTRRCFGKAWERYLDASRPSPGKHGTDGTDGTRPGFTRENSCSNLIEPTWNIVPSLPVQDGTRIHEGKTPNVPSVPCVPSKLSEGARPTKTSPVSEESEQWATV
jgi:hypothetical protein